MYKNEKKKEKATDTCCQPAESGRLTNTVYNMAEHQHIYIYIFFKRGVVGQTKIKTRQLRDNATIPKIFRGYNIVIFNM